jgi:hypothetical protein
MRGASVADIADALRLAYGHAYRRSDMLADLHRHRGSVEHASAAGHRDIRQLLARAGVAAFSLSLLLPTLASGATPRTNDVLVAGSIDDMPATAVEEVISIPNVRATVVPAATPTSEPTAAPTAVPTPSPYGAATFSGGPAVLVTASWYGPGFYENRLPCWQWLQANGLPIQLLPDTWGVAHKTLPCGTTLRLTHGANTITVPVVDRGPYVAGRELDLSPRVKAALGCTDLCSVVMQIPQ